MSVYNITDDFKKLAIPGYDPVSVREVLVEKRQELLDQLDQDFSSFKAHVASGETSFTDIYRGGYRTESDGALVFEEGLSKQLKALEKVQNAIIGLDAKRFAHDGTCIIDTPMVMDPTQPLEEQVLAAIDGELNLNVEKCATIRDLQNNIS